MREMSIATWYSNLSARSSPSPCRSLAHLGLATQHHFFDSRASLATEILGASPTSIDLQSSASTSGPNRDQEEVAWAADRAADGLPPPQQSTFHAEAASNWRLRGAAALVLQRHSGYD